MKNISRFIALVSMCFSCFAVQTVVAQGDERGGLEEVIVVAQKRAQSLQEVPIAITALSSKQIENQDIRGLEGLARQVPGLTFAPFSPGQNIVSLRGASSNDDGAGTDNSVAMFVDDIYLGRVSNINPDLFDLERIEVLRGPQGTLYGKNTIGGAINVLTKKPNKEQFEGVVKVDLGSYNLMGLGAYVTGPISDSIAGKLTVSSKTRDGWVENKSLNRHQKDNKTLGFRGQLLVDLGGDELLLSADFNNLDVDDMGRVPQAADYNNNEGGANPAAFRAGYEGVCGDDSGFNCVAGVVDGYAKREASGVSAKYIKSLSDDMSITAIWGYRNSDSDWHMDSSGSPSLPLIDDILDKSRQNSLEIRLAASPTDRLDYVVGLWLLNEKTDRSECFDLSLTTNCTERLSDAAADDADFYRQYNQTTSNALFGQVEYEINDRTSLIVGGRLSNEEKKIDNTSIKGNFVIINQDFNNTRSESWTAFTPRISLNYAASDRINVYATYSEGFKSGGFAAAPQTLDATDPLRPEKAQNIEIGTKIETNNVRFNASFYAVEYQDLQIQNFGAPSSDTPTYGTFGQFRSFNAADATVSGLEVEITIAVQDLDVNIFFGTADSEFGEIVVADNDLAYDLFYERLSQQKGLSLLRTPELKGGINLDYVLYNVADGELDFNLNYTFTDDQRQDLATYAIQPAFSVANFRMEWRKDALSVGLWVKNLLNEAYINHIYTIAGSVTAVYGEPRMVGASVSVRF